MRVLVTGGAGFIGSHLCDRFLADGHHVLCVDNFVTGSERNIAHLRAQPAFQFASHDISKPFEPEGPINLILHFASPASPIDYLKLPIQTLKVGSLGTLNALGIAKAKRAKFLLASTSEVYGDPQVHPQVESYWGHVNPVGPRGVYDEAKRFAEAMTMAYHRYHGLDTRIVRIFNSILADETVVVFNDHNLHLETIDRYAERLASRLHVDPPKILVPTFEPSSCRITLSEVSGLIKHPCQTDCFELSLRYGRRVRVTGDHSVFTCDNNAQPMAVPVRSLRVGDYVAVPTRLPAVEQDRDTFPLADELMRVLPDRALWDYALQARGLRSIIERRREEIHQFLNSCNRFHAKNRRNELVCASKKYWRQSLLPLPVFKRLGLAISPDARVGLFKAGARRWLPAVIPLTNDLLWLFGFFIAEGCRYVRPNKSAFISLSSHGDLIDRAARIIRSLGCHVIRVPYTHEHGTALFTHSRLLCWMFWRLLGDQRQKQFPLWVLQLPLSRLKHVLEGYREGDGTHSGKKLGQEICFDTTSERLAEQLGYLLLRFGVVACVGRYTTNFTKRYGTRRFPFFRLTVCEVDNFDVLSWDGGVRQTLNARRTGDVLWSKLTKIRKCRPTQFVYDFSVPGTENFVAGNGVFCHNTYGPRMRAEDGRAIPAFITQALCGEPLTVFGTGSQTRSFCYIDDLVEGIIRLTRTDEHDPVNLGNPEEYTIQQLAERIIALTKSASRIEFRPLPQDDPKQRCPDISLAKRLLGWSPRVSLSQGLDRTIPWFREHLALRQAPSPR